MESCRCHIDDVFSDPEQPATSRVRVRMSRSLNCNRYHTPRPEVKRDFPAHPGAGPPLVTRIQQYLPAVAPRLMELRP
jgi:hypothetical protein